MAFSSDDLGDNEPVAAINITPLVDVMLVLLIIFMVTAPMMQQGVEVDLPKATTAPLKGTNEQVVLSVDRAGKLFLGAGNEIPAAEVGKKIAAILETRSEQERKIYVKADSSVNYGVVMEVMGNLHAAGIYQIGLVSGLPEDAPKGGKGK